MRMHIERIQSRLSNTDAQTDVCRESWQSFTSHAIALVALVLIVYFPAMRGEFIWTDHAGITDNVYLRSWRGLSAIWSGPPGTKAYQPLVDTTYWLEYRLWGQRPLGFHLGNIVLHSVNALLFWRLLRRLGLPGAWLAAAIFAIHPIHVQSVAWVSQRGMLIAMLLSLASMMIFLRLRRSAESKSLFESLVATLLFALGVSCSSGVALVISVMVLVIVYWRSERAIVVGVAFILMFISLFAGADEGLPYALSGGQLQCFICFAIVAMSVSVLARFSYAASSGEYFKAFGGALGIILLASLALLSWHRAYLYRDELMFWRYAAARHPLSPVARNCLGVALLERGQPQLAIEHFQIALTANPGDASASVNLANAYAVIGETDNAIAQYRATLRIAPRRPEVLRELGSLYVRVNRRDDAMRHYLLAVDALPEDEVIHNNLGLLLAEDVGKLDEAIAHYRRAIRSNPFFIPARLNLAGAFFRHGDPAGASEQLQQVIRIDPNCFEAFMNSGGMLGTAREFQKAERMFRAAIHLKPESAEAYDNLGIALAAQGRLSEAVYSFGRAVDLKSEFALAVQHLANARRLREPSQAAAQPNRGF